MSLSDALRRRLRGPYLALGRLDARLHQIGADLAGQRAKIDEVAVELSDVRGQLESMPNELAALRTQLRVVADEVGLARSALGAPAPDESVSAGLTAMRADLEVVAAAVGRSNAVLRTLAADESQNRRRLHALREQPSYELAWSDPSPLVTVVIPTRDRTELLTTRALPSILAQTYSHLEILIVGDGEGPRTSEALEDLADPRVRYRNLPLQVRASEDPAHAYLVAATMARNAAGPSVRGRWLVHFDDDDAMRPDCVSTLLDLARETRAEAVYGRARLYLADGSHVDIGDWPPRHTRFTWASGMHHAGLRYLEREFVAAALDMPGDWWLAERMLRSGVRFGQCEELLADIYPSWTR
jgi:hypothetical protein